MKLTLIPVAQIDARHYRTTAGLVTYPVYPPSPRGFALRRQRIAAGLGLRVCATSLGISAYDLSKLQTGEATLSDDDWALLNEAMVKVCRQFCITCGEPHGWMPAEPIECRQCDIDRAGGVCGCCKRQVEPFLDRAGEDHEPNCRVARRTP